MSFTIDGEYNSATMHGSREMFDESCIEQVATMVDQPAFVGDDDIAVMPDGHRASGAVIGFTMPVKDRICPNTVGVDVGCFAGETKVELLDGQGHEIEKLAKRNEKFAVYSVTEEGEIDIAWANAKKTRKDTELITVKIDNGEEIRCTPDHRFMKRDGSYVEAQNLSSGESLMPLYKGKTDDGYVLDYHNIQKPTHGRSVREHWLVARSECMDIPKDVDDIVIHHKNFNKEDNRPSNLEFMNRSDHSKMHREMGGGEHWQSDEFEEKRINALKERKPTEDEIETSIENITTYMEENREEWLNKISDNGERGAEYLKDFNTSERKCDICGKVCDNPGSEYWHQINNHSEETEYNKRENHEVISVSDCDRKEDVYCLTVPKYGNFALSAGVFVHNCGMYAANFGQPDINLEDESVLAELDANIRDRVPTGFDVCDDAEYHMLNDFPWDECKRKITTMDRNIEMELPEPSVYDDDYFENTCKKVGHDLVRAINSIGSLGSGNHFVELGTDSNDDLWTVIHSGSRGPGAAIAQYWQDKATEHTFERRSTVEIPESEVQYFDGDAIRKQADGTFVASPGELSIDRDSILADYEGEAIDGKFGQLKSFMNAGKSDSTPFDYLEGDEASGYIVDMIFAQTYASVSRKLMADAVLESIESMVEQQQIISDSIESVHNYIDFKDATIRKGACRAHEGERLIVPFNMAVGTIIAVGRGHNEWNNSSAHGAGRAMSRTEATNRFDEAQFAEATSDVFMSEQPLDEIPSAYKDPDVVESALGESVTVVDRIEPVLTVKAP